MPVFFLMGLLYVLMGGEDHDTPAPTGRDEGVRRSDTAVLVGSDLSSSPVAAEGGDGNVTPEKDDSTAVSDVFSSIKVDPAADVASSTEVGSGERNEKPLDKPVALTSSTVVGEERKANADVPVPP